MAANPAAMAYVAYIEAMGQKMRKFKGATKGARLWEELPPDEQRGWWAAIRTVGAPECDE